MQVTHGALTPLTKTKRSPGNKVPTQTISTNPPERSTGSDQVTLSLGPSPTKVKPTEVAVPTESPTSTALTKSDPLTPLAVFETTSLAQEHSPGIDGFLTQFLPGAGTNSAKDLGAKLSSAFDRARGIETPKEGNTMGNLVGLTMKLSGDVLKHRKAGD